MSLDRLMLIVIACFGGLVFLAYVLGAFAFAAAIHPALVLVVLAVLGFVVYVGWRLLAERLNNPEEDHYDGMKH